MKLNLSAINAGQNISVRMEKFSETLLLKGEVYLYKGDHYIVSIEDKIILRIGRRRFVETDVKVDDIFYQGKLVGMNFKFKKDFP